MDFFSNLYLFALLIINNMKRLSIILLTLLLVQQRLEANESLNYASGGDDWTEGECATGKK
jgi:hypothetical protein